MPGFGRGHRSNGLFELLIKLSNQFFFVQSQKPRVLPHKTAGENAARQTIELIGFNGLDQMQTNFGSGGYVFDVKALTDTFTAERLADRSHNGLLQAPLSL
jgi:hypothetical protein